MSDGTELATCKPRLTEAQKLLLGRLYNGDYAAAWSAQARTRLALREAGYLTSTADRYLITEAGRARVEQDFLYV